MEFRVELDQLSGVAQFYVGNKPTGSVIHLLSGDDWKRLDIGKMEVASNLWSHDAEWKLSVYPIDPKTGYIKLNRSYPVTLTLCAAAPVAV